MERNSPSVVFVSNYYNHHQKYLSDAMYRLTGGRYYFIETEVIEQERLSMGWGGEIKPSYVRQTYISETEANACQTIIDNSDVVIIGSAPHELIRNRIKRGKLVFRYSERPLKKGSQLWKYPFRLLLWRMQNYCSSNVYMLCASAYTSADYAQFGMYRKKCFKWGYFPEVKQYDRVDSVIEKKQPASILWVARLIDWKHPELPILIAEKLKKDGYDFTLNMIGNGALEQDVEQLIQMHDLSDRVHLLGSMSPEQVREHMENSEIFMMTSDRNEGWGAVLNEAMNSCCAVVASHAIGATPFLLRDGENGMIYKDGDTEDLYDKVRALLDDQTRCHEYGKRAYRTMTEMWNADVAAERFLTLAGSILNGQKGTDLFSEGPCSRANVLKDDWYYNC